MFAAVQSESQMRFVVVERLSQRIWIQKKGKDVAEVVALVPILRCSFDQPCVKIVNAPLMFVWNAAFA